jgi:hypothetical protein
MRRSVKERTTDRVNGGIAPSSDQDAFLANQHMHGQPRRNKRGILVEMGGQDMMREAEATAMMGESVDARRRMQSSFLLPLEATGRRAARNRKNGGEKAPLPVTLSLYGVNGAARPHSI